MEILRQFSIIVFNIPKLCLPVGAQWVCCVLDVGSPPKILSVWLCVCWCACVCVWLYGIFWHYHYFVSLSFLSFFFCIFSCVSLQAGESNGLFKKTISKLSTEYRLQFVWPNVRRIRDQSGSSVQRTTATTTAKEQQQQEFQPKKSISLGAIRGQHGYQQHHPLHQPDLSRLAAMPSVHKKRTTNQKEGATKTFHLVLSLFLRKKKQNQNHLFKPQTKLTKRMLRQKNYFLFLILFLKFCLFL